MKKQFGVTLCALFIAPHLLFGKINRSPEDVIDALFRGWRTQNQTYMTVVGIGGLSQFGKTMSAQTLLDYQIDWSERYQKYTVMKTTVKTKSVEQGLKTHFFYWILEKVDGSWLWRQGFPSPSGRDLNYKEAFNIYWKFLRS
ncbi:MAG: hypothetical protein JSR44_07445 [Spirochaetes bacterium]|nr:hypothetical protein [Spirochaetota bacterium]